MRAVACRVLNVLLAMYVSLCALCISFVVCFICTLFHVDVFPVVCLLYLSYSALALTF